MIISEALFDAAQASLVLSSTQRFAAKSSPLIPFVHCLASHCGQVPYNNSLEPTRFHDMANVLPRARAAQFNRYAYKDN